MPLRNRVLNVEGNTVTEIESIFCRFTENTHTHTTRKPPIRAECLIWVPRELGCFWAEETCAASAPWWKNKHLFMKLEYMCSDVCMDTHTGPKKSSFFFFPKIVLTHTQFHTPCSPRTNINTSKKALASIQKDCLCAMLHSGSCQVSTA